MRIRTNIASANAQRRLGMSTEQKSSSMERLASGERINKAADDAAGLAVSENLRADVRSLNQAKRNALDGISLVQTAEGGLNETGNMIIRLRELAVQAASDTIGDTERRFLDEEYQGLKREIDRIALSTEFNGTRLLIGQAAVPTDLLESQPDFPLEVQVSKDYYTGTDAVASANPVNVIRIDLQKLNALSSGENSLNIDVAKTGEQIAGISSKREAQLSITSMDQAISKIAAYRSFLGAVQAHIGRATQNLGVQIENLDVSRSRIRDADYANETAEFTKANIIQQAGTAVLSQANQTPSVALSLLQRL